MGRIIVVEDNIIYSDFVCRLLESKGYPSVSTSTCNGARMLFAKMREDDIILADLRLNDGDGISLLEELRKQGKNNPYIVMTDYDEVPTAVRSMKQGAEDYIPKKLIEANLFPLLKTLRKRMERHDTPIHERQSTAFREIYRKIKLVAPTNMSVLILGESGTGKEHIAEKIHTMSKRSAGPFVAVDCGLLSKELASSTLFGHEKGAFTGAESKKQGFWEEAAGGTLFLDEIGNLSYHLQAKLLTALQRRSIVRVGSNTPIPINIRLICATNRDLQEMVQKEQFREDLLYRINTIHVEIPPLRERPEDIVPLTEIFITKYTNIYGKKPMALTDDAKEKLKAQPWLGNIRELEHTVEKAIIIADGDTLDGSNFDFPRKREVPVKNDITTLEEMEYTMIKAAMDKFGGNLSLVANQLGISRQTLYNKIKRYEL